MLTQPGQRFFRTYFYIKQLSEQKNITILYNEVKNLNQNFEKQHEDQDDVLHRCLTHTRSYFQWVNSKECMNPTIHSIEQHAKMNVFSMYIIWQTFWHTNKSIESLLQKNWSVLRKLRQVRLKKSKKGELPKIETMSKRLKALSKHFIQGRKKQ